MKSLNKIDLERWNSSHIPHGNLNNMLILFNSVGVVFLCKRNICSLVNTIPSTCTDVLQMRHFACMASVGFTRETSHFAVCCKFALYTSLRCERKDRGQKMYGNSTHGLLVAQPFQDKNEFDSSGFSKGNGKRINVQKKSKM